MKILIIGGTQFVGRAFTEAALERGHQLTLFHRGKTNPDLFPQVEHIHGDRLDPDAFKAVKEQKWDVVFDTCGYFPRAVSLSAEALADCGSYLFISSISVFKDLAKIGLKEDDETGTLKDETVEEITGETYGPLKVLCENVVKEAFGDRALIIRPGLIVGPHDPTDRFTYWPRRFYLAKDAVLVPDCKNQPVQQIDVRDLTAWCLMMLESQASGVYSATGPESPIPLEQAITSVQQAVNPGAKIIWVDAEFLRNKEVNAWTDMPMVLPYDGSSDGMRSADISKALAEGLKFRSFEQTAYDTLDWWKSNGSPALKTGLTDEKEAELLAEYCART